MSTIHDLYHDNLCLADRIFNKNSEVYKLQMKLTSMSDELSEKLNEEEKKKLIKIDDTHTRITSMLECDAFAIGLKVGIRLMHEVFQDDVPDCATFPLV